jgi:Icc-related predicted phosphoesterase
MKEEEEEEEEKGKKAVAEPGNAPRLSLRPPQFPVSEHQLPEEGRRDEEEEEIEVLGAGYSSDTIWSRCFEFENQP